MLDSIDIQELIEGIHMTRMECVKKSIDAEKKKDMVSRKIHDGNAAFCDFLIEQINLMTSKTINLKIEKITKHKSDFSDLDLLDVEE